MEKAIFTGARGFIGVSGICQAVEAIKSLCKEPVKGISPVLSKRNLFSGRVETSVYHNMVHFFGTDGMEIGYLCGDAVLVFDKPRRWHPSFLAKTSQVFSA